MNYETRKALVLVAGGVSVGGGLGYFLAAFRLKKKYQQISEDEIASVKDSYQRRYKAGPYADVSTTAAELVPEHAEGLTLDQEVLERRVRDLGYSSSTEEVSVKTQTVEEDGEEVEVTTYKSVTETTNVFDNLPDGADVPNPDRPYLIPIEEYMDQNGDFSEHDKLTITYYEGDKVLCDERDEDIPDVEGTVGRENLNHFGYGSQDEDILYVRNERIRTDFEVVRSEGYYTLTVNGEDPRILEDRDDPPRVRKMRDERHSR